MNTLANLERAEIAEARHGGGSGVAALQLSAVSKRYRREGQAVLDQVNLRIEPGETVAITGRNGAGKTTLLRIACGLITPDSGSVSAFGMSPEKQRREYQMNVGFLPAGNSGLYARLTVRQHLAFWSRLAFIPRDAREGRIEAALTDLGLEDLADRRVDRMSMGQRQRVRIAMAFMHEPRLVMLDEPSNSLDDDGAMRLVDAVRRAVARAGAVVVCSPNEVPGSIQFDRQLAIRDGVLVSA